MEEDDIFLKIVLLGNEMVGKTRFFDSYFDEEYFPESTIGANFRTKFIEKNNNNIKVLIYDTPGQERLRSIVINYFKVADGIILIYDASNIDSYNGIKKWIEIIKECIDFEQIGFIVVENKCDLPEEEKKINSKMREEMEENFGFKIIIASAKDNINVNESVDLLIDKMMTLREKKEKILI